MSPCSNALFGRLLILWQFKLITVSLDDLTKVFMSLIPHAGILESSQRLWVDDNDVDAVVEFVLFKALESSDRWN